MSNEANGLGLNQEESSVVAVLIVVAVIGLALYFWYDNIWVFLKIIEIKLILFLDFLWTEHYVQKMTIYLYKLQRINPDVVTINKMMKVDGDIQLSIGWIYSFILVYYGGKIFFRQEHKTKHDLESLLAEQTKYWRFNRHLLKYNPLKESLDITEGQFAIRMRPHVFAFKNELLNQIETDDFKELYKLDKAKAKAVFEKQLGPVFSGYDTMERYHKWLAAVFLLFAHERESQAWDLLGDISYAYNDENPLYLKSSMLMTTENAVKKAKGEWPKAIARLRCLLFSKPYNLMVRCKFYATKGIYSLLHILDKDLYFKIADTKADEVLKLFGDSEISKRAKNTHFYTYGVLRSLLAQAHEFGVLATGRMTWLKIEDRTLWFLLSDEGMLETSVECAYPRTHYECELQIGRKLTLPQGERYLDVFEAFLAEKNLVASVEVAA